MLRCLPHPRRILLCDVFQAASRLEALAKILREELRYHGDLRIATSKDRLSAEIYSATLIVGATNVPNLRSPVCNPARSW